MEIKTLYETIKNKISGGVLILSDDNNTARVFSGFVWGCGQWEFPLKNAQVIFDGISIGLTGTAEFPPLSGAFSFSGQIIKNSNKLRESDPEFLFSIKANAKINGKVGDFFGYIYPLIVRNETDNTILEYKDVLNDTEISDFVLTYADEDDFNTNDYNFKFTCKMRLSGEEYFNNDTFWSIIKAASGNSLTSQTAFESEGRISFLYSGSALSFYAKIALGSINLDRYFTGKTVPKNVTAFLEIRNAIGGSERAAVSGGLTLSLMTNGKEKEFTLSSDILSGEHYLNFSADLGYDGVTISDGIDFLGSLFAVNKNASKYLHIPTDSFINKIALKSLLLGFRLGTENETEYTAADDIKFNLWAAGCSVGLNSPWTSPIAQIVCTRLDIDFAGQWATIGTLITGDVSAEFEVTLSDVHTLTFSATALLPDLEFTGSILLEKDSDKKLSTVLGTDAAASLPVSNSVLKNSEEIAQIDVIANFSARFLSISAEVNNVFSFGFGSALTFSLENVSAGAEFAQTGNTFSLSGVFSLSLSEDGVKKLLLAVGAVCRTVAATRENSTSLLWDFSGNLDNPDNITFGDIISKLIGGNARGGNFDFALTNFSIKYQYQKERDINPLTITAKFAGTWDLSFLSSELKLENGGQIAFSTAEDGSIKAAAMLYFASNIFDLTAQAQYAKTALKTAFSYIFELTFGGKGLRAGYYSESFSGKENKFLKGNLVNVTLGDLADMFVKLFNPNFRAGNLPAPLDTLYKIDLSKIIFTYNLTEKTASADYEVNLNLLIITVNSVGLSYNIENGSDVIFTLKYTQIGDGIETAGSETAWGLINGTPPSFGGANENTPFKLNFLLIAERFNTSDNAFSKQNATSISAVFDALEADKSLSRYDADVHFVLCADFTIAEDFNCKLAIIDPNIYGARITISENAQNSLLKTFAGFFAELFYKRISDKLGVLKVSVMMPTAFRKFIIGPVTVTLGLLQAEIYTDGGFLIDLGFPHGGDFTNSFEFSFGVFLGRGGVYFGIMSGASQPSLPTNKTWGTVVAIGVGVTFGVGRSLDLGIVKAGFELSMTAIFEGLLAFAKNDQSGCIKGSELANKNVQNDSDIYYKIYAKVAITGKLFVSVDLFIIKLEASVLIFASADVTAETGKATIINLDFNLTLRGSVKILFFRVNFSYNFSYTARFEIDSNDGVQRIRSFYGALPTENRKDGEKLSIPLYFDYSFTKANDGDKIVFVPTINFPDAGKLIKLMSERVLDLLLQDRTDLAFNDVIFLDETQFAENNITYEVIENLLQNNAEFIITNTPTVANGDEAGVIIPIPPPLTFVFEDIETLIKITTDYSNEIKIDNAYSEILEKYFDKFNISKDGKKKAPEPFIKPLAEILFASYFQMIGRQVLMLTKSLYKDFQIGIFDGSFIDFNSLAEHYAVNVNDIVADNGELILSGIDFSPCYIIFSLRKNASINELSDSYGIVADEVFTQLKDNYILADTRIDVADFSFTAGNLRAEYAGGFFFSRAYSELITAVWQRIFPDVVNALAEFEMLPEYTEKYRHREIALPVSVKITLPDFDEPFEWYIQTGDNAESIAKTIAIICYGKSAYEYDAETDALFEDFKSKISGTEIINVPAMSNVMVYASETPEMFFHRIFASKTLTDQMKMTAFGSVIIARFADIKLKNPVFKTVQGMKLSKFTATIPANVKTFARDLSPAHFAAGQTIIINPRSLPKSILIEKITDEEFLNAVASLLSRVYSQGLRLPSLNGANSTEEDFNLTPFFKLLRLQLDCIKDKVYSFSFSAETDKQSWLTGKTEGNLTAQSIGDCNWTENTEIKILEFPFEKQPKAYAASRSFTVLSGDVSFAVYQCPTGMEITDNVTLTVGEEATAFKKALFIEMDVTAVAETVLTLNNISASDRDRLGLISQLIFNNPSANINFRILFEPSAKSGISDIYMDTGFASTEKLVKTNLSRITKLSPNINEIAEERYTVSDFSSPDSLVMLWECAVTCGGYQLHTIIKNKLPSDIFDNKNGKIYLFVYGDEVPATAANCAAAEARAATAAGVFNMPMTEYTPTIPPGCIEIDIKYTPKDPDSVFQIISYELREIADSESKPLIPLDKSVSSVFSDDVDNAETLYYAPVIPMYSILGETSPYARFENRAVNIRMRDIFGNVAEDSKTVNLSFAYNDFLTDINEYPGMQVRYDIDEKTAAVLIKFIPSGNITEAEAQKLQAIIFELEDLRDNGGTVTVNSNILMPETTITADVLAIFVKSVLNSIGTEQIFSFTPRISDSKNIFIPSVKISLERPGKDLSGSDIPERVYSVSCDILPGAQKSGGKSAEDFAADFEAVFAGTKLAYKNSSSGTLYAVKTANAIGQINLAGHENYYAIPPVANEPISADIAFTINNTPVNIHYSEADLNLFFAKFSDDFENYLCEYQAISSADNNTLRKLINAKATLAGKIAQTATAVLDDGTANSTSEYLKNYLKNLLLEKINAEISSAASYAVAGNNAAVRINTSIKTQPDSVSNAIINSSKIDHANEFIVFYTAAEKYKNIPEPSFDAITVREFETNIIEQIDGYESSDWYQFLIPLSLKAPDVSQNEIPNPLKEIPLPPLPSNPCFYPPENNEPIYSTKYGFEITAKCIAQDDINIVVIFTQISETSNPDNSFVNALGKYIYLRDEILKNADIELFTECATEIADSYQIVSPIKMQNKLSEKNFCCTARVDFTSGKVVIYDATPGFNYTVIQPETITAGKHFTFGLELAGLSVYEIESASANVKITRNSSLTAPFVFKTEEKSLPAIFPCNKLSKQSLGTVNFSESDYKSADILKKLIDALGGNKVQNSFDAVITCFYSYEIISDMPVRLPLIMIKTKLSELYSESRFSEIAENLSEKLNTIKPIVANSAVTFKLAVYNGETLIIAVDLEVSGNA